MCMCRPELDITCLSYFLHPVHFRYWCRTSHWNLDLAGLASQLSPQGSSVSTWEEQGPQVRICVGLHACTTNTSLSEPSPQLWILILIYITLGYTMIIHSSAVSTHFGSSKHRNLGAVTPILHGAHWAATHTRVFNVIWDSCHWECWGKHSLSTVRNLKSRKIVGIAAKESFFSTLGRLNLSKGPGEECAGVSAFFQNTKRFILWVESGEGH